MPIEFRCPGCSKLLRTPDESAGKKARCPDCGTIADVPVSTPLPGGVAPAPPELTSPFAAPSSPFTTAPTSVPPDDGAVNPYASPTVATGPDLPPPSAAERSGLPWEGQGKSLATFWKTAKLILGDSSQAFRMMRREAGMGDSLLFALCGGVCGGLIVATYLSILSVAMIGFFRGVAGAGAPQPFPMGGFIAIQVASNFFWGILGGTVGTIFSVFIGAAIVHLMLLLVKGANSTFETTVSVVAYVSGATSLLLAIPIPYLNALVVWVASLIYEIIGLAEAHETTKGKTAAAVLLPMVFCCVVSGLLVGLAMYFLFQQAGRF
jgi:hypothetical protein